MTKIDEERDRLRTLTDWEPYLLAHSGLPGPRGNLELAHAVALEADPDRILRYAAMGPEEGPIATGEELLTVCGAIGLGRLAAEADRRRQDVRVLRKALGYCWSVAAAALPAEGTGAMEPWMDRDDPDLRWVARENLRKSRLVKAAPEWSASWRHRLGVAR